MASSILDRSPSRIRMLEREVGIKNYPSRQTAYFGIVGLPGTGRKTLGFRFGQSGGVINEVPAQYSYLAHFDWAIRRNNTICKVIIFIRGFIIEPPVEMPREIPPSYYEHMDRFFCLLFLLDLTDAVTMMDTCSLINSFCGEYEELPESYLVRNKIDDRHYAHSRSWLAHIARETISHREMRYYECSAKYCINIYPLISRILEVSTREIV